MDGSGGGGGDFVQAQTVQVTAGNLTTTSATFGDVAGMSITMATAAARCLVVVICIGHMNGATDMCLDIDIDGARQGQDYGLCFCTGANTVNQNLCFSRLTGVLTAASHTFKLQARVQPSGTFTLFASTTISPLIFTVIETSLTA